MILDVKFIWYIVEEPILKHIIGIEQHMPSRINSQYLGKMKVDCGKQVVNVR
jgi:hypothetical protein